MTPRADAAAVTARATISVRRSALGAELCLLKRSVKLCTQYLKPAVLPTFQNARCTMPLSEISSSTLSTAASHSLPSQTSKHGKQIRAFTSRDENNKRITISIDILQTSAIYAIVSTLNETRSLGVISTAAPLNKSALTQGAPNV